MQAILIRKFKCWGSNKVSVYLKIFYSLQLVEISQINPNIKNLKVEIEVKHTFSKGQSYKN